MSTFFVAPLTVQCIFFYLQEGEKGVAIGVYNQKQVKHVGGAGRRDSIVKLETEESPVQPDSV